MTTVLLFFIVISVLIVIHEFGHFIAARAFNVRVEEFALGFPPRIASVVRGETRYSINAIPIGGYVKLTGEEDPTDPRSLATRSIRVRVTILLAGIFMNLALTLVLFAVFFTFPPEVVGTQVIVARVEPGSPAYAAGMLPGDVFLRSDLSFEGSTLQLLDQPEDADPYGGTEIQSLRDVTDYTQDNLGRQVSFLMARGNTPVIVRLIPRANPPPDQGPMGIGVGVSGGEVVTRFSPSLSVIPESFVQVYRFVTTIGESIGNIFTSSEGREGLAGPIGIAQVTGEVARTGVLPFIGFVAILSLNLALFNLLPIPALDGGRLLFVIIEAFRGGRRIAPKREALVHLMGFMFLIAVIVVISFNDIGRLIRGEQFLP